MDPRAILVLRTKEPRSLGGQQMKDVHADREIGGCHDAEPRLCRLRAQAIDMRVPAGRTDDERHAQLEVAWKVLEQRVSGRKVDGRVGGRPFLAAGIHTAHDVHPLLGGKLVDELAHLPVADDEKFHGWKNSSWRRSMA